MKLYFNEDVLSMRVVKGKKIVNHINTIQLVYVCSALNFIFVVHY